MVEVYEPRAGEIPAIYEMGIPVVETSDRYHINIAQKIPLNTDRDNVPPGFLRDVRVEVLNATYAMLSPEDAKAPWVTNAMEDERVDPEAVKAAFAGRFGDKAVIFDPNDPEANKLAASQGFTVVPGGALPKAAWTNVKSGGVALPAGKVTPSPKPDEGKEEAQMMDPEHWPENVAQVADWAKWFAYQLLGRNIEVEIATAVTWPYAATYGPGGTLTLNLGRLGYKWFDGELEPIMDLLIHEFGHEFCGDHLSHDYLHALTKLGAKAVTVALAHPMMFIEWRQAFVGENAVAA